MSDWSSAVCSSGLADGRRGLALADLDAAEHAATLGGVAVLAGDAVEALAQMRSLVAHDLAEAVVAPELLQRHAGGDEGMVVAAEGAVVLAGRPDVVLRLQQHHGERQAHARQRLGERDDVRSDPHPLEGEEAAGTPAAGLNVVDDEQAAVLARQALHAAQPLR